jgi:hypothetical protein
MALQDSLAYNFQFVPLRLSPQHEGPLWLASDINKMSPRPSFLSAR